MFSERFHIKESPDLGRYVTSLKNYDPGDIIWQESALISAPNQRLDVDPEDPFPFNCVGCFKNISTAQMKCPVCAWPCCSFPCSVSEFHKKYECPIFARNKIPVSQDTFDNIIYIRFSMYKTLEPEKHEKLLTMCSKYDEMDLELKKALRKSVLWLHKFLAIDCELDVTESEVLKMIPIFQTNNFLIAFAATYLTDFTGQGVFEYSSLISHCCSPNLQYSFYKVLTADGNIDWKIQFHARRAICVGEILSISYGCGELTFGTAPRQVEIRKSRHFRCRCSRCYDRREEETYFSAIICPSCKKGNVLPENPIKTGTSPWICDSCPFMMASKRVKDKIVELSAVPLTLYEMYSEPNQHSLDMADSFIQSHSGKPLHKNHYLLFQCAVHWLTGMNDYFAPLLISRTEEAQQLFMKIITRLKRFLPISIKFGTSAVNAKLHFLKAQVFATFIFHSMDMMTLGQVEILPCDKIRTTKNILRNLRASLFWQSMQPNSVNFQTEVTSLNSLTSLWSDRLDNFIAEYNLVEESSLESLQYLF